MPATVRQYERLFTEARPDAVRGADGEYLPFTDFLTPNRSPKSARGWSLPPPHWRLKAIINLSAWAFRDRPPRPHAGQHRV